MSFIKQLLIILAFYLLGEFTSFSIALILPNLFIPGSIIGMLLLAVLLLIKLIKLEWVDSISTFFISNMAFFFVPSVVSLLAYFDIIIPVLGRLILILLISFCLTFVAVGSITKLSLKLLYKKGEKND